MAKRGRKKKVREADKNEPAAETANTETSAPQHRGRKSQYDPETRTAILKATADSRNEGKSWAEALDAAKAAGFKGALPYLMKLAHDSGSVKGRRRKRRAAAAPGRPQTRGRGAAIRNVASMQDIEKIVNSMVETRVRAAIDRAAATLEQTVKELHNL